MMAPLFGGAGLFFLHLALAFASRAAGGAFGGVLAGASYLLPLCLFFLFSREKCPPLLAPPTRAGWRRVWPLFPFFLLAVLGAAEITSALTGETAGAAADGPFFYAVLAHALLPAFLEEGLFRLALLSLFLRRARGRVAVPLVALLFALSHPAFAQMPYAFVGGLFLGFAALSGGSVFYAFAFHFGNNLLSLCLQRMAPPRAAVYGVLAAFCVLAGAALVVRKRRETAPVCRERRKS